MLIALIIVFLNAQPLGQIILILLISIASAVLTLATRPFVYLLLNVFRGLVELLAVVIVTFHLIYYSQEQRLWHQEVIDQGLVQ